MAVKTKCPACGVEFSVPDRFHHKKARCSSCKHEFVVLTSVELFRARQKEKRLDQKQIRQPSAATSRSRPRNLVQPPKPVPELRNCPVCKTEVSSWAKSCPHCGQPFSTEPATKGTTNQPQTKEPPGCAMLAGTLTIVTGLAGIVFFPLWIFTAIFAVVFVIASIVGAEKDRRKGKR